MYCFRDDQDCQNFDFDFPEIPKLQISSMLDQNIEDKYYYTSTWDLLSENFKEHNKIYQYRRVYVRENKSNECPTLTTNMGQEDITCPL